MAAVVQGSLDRAEPDGALEGWCWSADAPDAHRTVAVTVDGHIVARAVCDRPRDDLVQAGIGSGDHAFALRLDAAARRGAEAEVALRDVATGQVLGAARRVLWRGDEPPPAREFSGNFDRVTRDGWVSGWCWYPAEPSRKVALEVLVDEAVVGTTLAANWRADLANAGIGDGAHGFSFALPYEVLARQGALRVGVREAAGRRPLGEPALLRIGRLAEGEQQTRELERQVRLLRGRVEELARAAMNRPAAEERAARALFTTVAGFFQELADGTPPDARGYGFGAGLRTTLESLRASLPPLAWRSPQAEADMLLIVPATEPVDLVHRCLVALHAAGADMTAEILVLDPGDVDAGCALLPALVPGLRYRHRGEAGFVAMVDAAVRDSAMAIVALIDPRIAATASLLPELRATLRDAACAVVGASVLRADGLIQHGGFRAGPGGVLHDPAQFCEAEMSAWRFLRPVTAIAALAVAFDRARWIACGGLDGGFGSLAYAMPALCVRARARGHAVLLQPAAVAHWIGPHDPDPSSTVPDTTAPHEDARRLRLALLEAGAATADAFVGRALFVEDAVPRPDRDAGSVLALALMRALCQLGWQVVFAPASGAAPAAADRARLERCGIEVALPPEHDSVTGFLREHGADLGLVLITRHANAHLLAPRVREFAPDARLVFLPADLHFLRETREAVLAGRKPAASHRLLRAREVACVRAADATLLLSDHEHALLAAEIDPARLHVLRWIVEPAPPGPAFSERDGVLFVGNFAHRPNVDAVLWYARAIAPLLRRVRPGVILHVVGADPPPEIAALDGADCVVHGWVEDLDATLARVRLSVAPLRYGAGFKGKIATSLAHGVPVAATSIALEGTGLAEGDGVMLADDPAALAAAIVTLHDDARAWAAASARARERVAALYSPGAAAEILRAMLRALALPSLPT